jgi:hypothetical protein
LFYKRLIVQPSESDPSHVLFSRLSLFFFPINQILIRRIGGLSYDSGLQVVLRSCLLPTISRNHDYLQSPSVSVSATGIRRQSTTHANCLPLVLESHTHPSSAQKSYKYCPSRCLHQMPRTFYVVPASSDGLFQGNPAAVVLIDELLVTDTLMKIAADFNQPIMSPSKSREMRGRRSRLGEECIYR